MISLMAGDFIFLPTSIQLKLEREDVISFISRIGKSLEVVVLLESSILDYTVIPNSIMIPSCRETI